MPALAEPPVQEAPPIQQDGGFADRLTQTISSDPNAARLPGFGAPKEVPKEITPEPKQEVKTDAPSAKEAAPEKKTGASEMLKQLAAGEKKEGDKTEPKTPLTSEQKRDYTIAQMRKRAEEADIRIPTLEKDLAARDAKIAEFESKYKDIDPDLIKKTMEEKDKTIEEKEKTIARLNLLESTKFKKEVTGPLDTYKAELRSKAEKFKFSWRGLEEALLTIADPDEQLAQIDKVLDEAEIPLSASQRANIIARVENINVTTYDGAMKLQNAGEVKKSMDAEEKRKSMEDKEVSAKTFKDGADFVFKQMFSEEMLEDMPFLAPKGEDGKPVVDKAVLEGIRKAAVAEKEPWRLALDSYSAEVLPLVMDYAKEKDAKIAELEERIGKLSGAGPKGGGEIKHEDGKDADASLTMQDRLEKIMKAQGRM